MTGQHAERKRLPDTRDSITHKVVIDLFTELYITVGHYPDTGQPGEVFLTLGKVGSTMRGMLDLMGIQFSLLLQNGVELDALCRKFENVQFEPHGRTDNPNISECKSIADYVGKWLRWRYIDHAPTRTEQGSDRGPEGETGGEEAGGVKKVRKGTKS